MNSQAIATVPVDSIRPRPGNPRKHSAAQVRKIARSLERFGWTNPILADAEGNIICGEGRYLAARKLGMQSVPVLCISHLSQEEIRAYVIADNRLAELAGWDRELLRVELSGLMEIDFDLELTGFDMGEIDLLLQEPEEAGIDEVPSPQSGPPVSRRGDVWLLGRHRLLCGDARSAEDWNALMNGARAQMVFTDPPYNVRIDGHVSGLGSVKHREFAMASGEMTEAEFIAFLEEVCRHMAAASQDGSLHYICMDWRHLYELLTAGRAVYAELKNLCVWAKTNGGMGSLYRSQHELVTVFKQGTGRHINNIELGKHGRNRTNLWTYPGMTALGSERSEALAMHPTVKPVGLVADAILDATRRTGIVVDPFCGSGTTVMAAERTGRACYAMELDPIYADTIVRRWQSWTGGQARHEASKLLFAEMAESRRSNEK